MCNEVYVLQEKFAKKQVEVGLDGITEERLLYRYFPLRQRFKCLPGIWKWPFKGHRHHNWSWFQYMRDPKDAISQKKGKGNQ